MINHGGHRAATEKQRVVSCRAWDNQPKAGCMSPAEPALPAAASQPAGKAWGKHSMQGWGKLAPGPCGPLEEELDEEMLRQ